MPAAWQASGTLLGALTTADVTPVIPARAADDIMICLTANRVITNTCATPSLWTAYANNPMDTTAWRTYMFWRRATSGTETNPLCDWTATSADKYAQVHTIRGAITTGDPFLNPTFNTGGTDPGTLSAVTTDAANQLVVMLGIGADNLATAATVTATDPASLTQRHFSTIATGADANGWFHSATRTTAGSTGTISADFNGVPLHWCMFAAAILEPPPAPSGSPRPYIFHHAAQRASRW